MTVSMGRKILIPALSILLATSCSVNKDIMFKTPTDYVFDALPDSIPPDFKIQQGDNIQFRLFANNGFKIIDLVSQGGQDKLVNNRQNVTYVVEHDGLVKLPLLDRVSIIDMTLREAEMFLEGLYTKDYNDPFVQLSVINRRVVVFPGGGGTAEVVTLENNNTTLLEVLGLAGGIPRRANASRVKVFRRNVSSPQRLIYQFDLSTIEGLKFADMVMQGDDIVYVQPNPEIARELLYDLNPVLTLLTSAVLVYGIIRGFN